MTEQKTGSVRLGERYEDTVTGYSGVAPSRTEYLHDAPSVRLTRANTEGVPEDVWLPEGRCEEVVQAQPVGARMVMP
ncbi:MAG TPA: hypothetical protein VFH54_06025 [Mycobacteriales bacterium]|nr:hypothetical protein [Mycobacteriales bacterium]